MVNLKNMMERTEAINAQLARYGVKFGIYKNGCFQEQLFPYDPIPRVIEAEEFAYLERKCAPRTFRETAIEDNRNYPKLLKHAMDYVNPGGLCVVLTPGRYNAAYFEHSYLAEQMGIPLVTCNDLEVEGDSLYFTGYAGKKERVGAVYNLYFWLDAISNRGICGVEEP